MWTRRRLLAAGGGAALSPLLPGQTGPGRGPAPRPALRVAFLTDAHLPAGGHNDQMRRALELAQTRYRAGLILFGGDNVYAAETGPRESAGAQLENWQRLVGDAVRVGRASVLGNHDCWGLNKGGKDFESGRRAAMRAFGMPSRYYAFERAGWRFLMLDTVQPVPSGYSAFIDAEQQNWLQRQLENTKPTVIVGHVPVISGAQLVAGETIHKGGAARLPHSRVLGDAREVTELFRRSPQVKMYLCGHLHMIERLRFRGIEYMNGGAVCGGWWKGEYEHFGPHMAIIDLFADGNAFSRSLAL
ncbi:hypothetical protein EON79_19385 [bacterium]|nr:MAG: hypothetical protein EON79_19385 [bacterium]